MTMRASGCSLTMRSTASMPSICGIVMSIKTRSGMVRAYSVMADLVLMDITMPQMEGIEAVERIVNEHPDARIVMVSSVGYQDNILAALQKGARHFVQQPVKPDALYEIIRYVLNDDGVAS